MLNDQVLAEHAEEDKQLRAGNREAGLTRTRAVLPAYRINGPVYHDIVGDDITDVRPVAEEMMVQKDPVEEDDQTQESQLSGCGIRIIFNKPIQYVLHLFSG